MEQVKRIAVLFTMTSALTAGVSGVAQAESLLPPITIAPLICGNIQQGNHNHATADCNQSLVSTGSTGGATSAVGGLVHQLLG